MIGLFTNNVMLNILLESYFRNVSFALNLISTFFFITITVPMPLMVDYYPEGIIHPGQ